MVDIKNIQLTKNTLQNIYIMAPLLDELGQNQVFGLMIGLINGSKKTIQDNNRKAG